VYASNDGDVPSMPAAPDMFLQYIGKAQVEAYELFSIAASILGFTAMR
jgi:hypothetical protein